MSNGRGWVPSHLAGMQLHRISKQKGGGLHSLPVPLFSLFPSHLA